MAECFNAMIGSVRSGYRPVIQSNSWKFMSAIIQDCWQHDSSSRPYASQISQLLGDHFDRLTSSDTRCSSASSTPITAVLECDAVSVGINSNPLSTVSVCPIVNHGGHNGNCDTVAAENTQTPLNCSNESMQSALYCTSESNGITHGGSSTPSRGTCNTDVNIETDLEILPQDSPGPVLASELALNTELVNSQTNNDVECMQIDYDHDRLAYKDLSQSSQMMHQVLKRSRQPYALRSSKNFKLKQLMLLLMDMMLYWCSLPDQESHFALLYLLCLTQGSFV